MSEDMELEYVVLTLDDLDDVADFLAKYFYPREDLSLGTGLTQVDPTAGLWGQKLRKSLTSGVSVGVRERSSRRLVAVLTADIMTSPSELTEAEYGSDPMAKIFRVLEIGWLKFNIFQDPGVERILELDRACVHPDYCRRGIFTALVQKCIDLAHNDCQIVRLETTSLFSEKACVRLGFETRAIVDYSTLEDGLLDLSKMYSKVMKIMTKPLSAKPAEVPCI